MRQTQLIVALDVDTWAEAERHVDALGDTVEWYKIGKQIFTNHGPRVVEALKKRGKKVFLDLKFHDIPNTVAQAVRAAGSIGADMTNVHASGGPAMMKSAAAAATTAGVTLVAVTVLTSLNAEELSAIGFAAGPEQQVLRLARLAKAAGVPGVVCSPLEIALLKRECGPEFLLVVPGIRPAGGDLGDQKRVMTPAEAAAAGADYIVVGRPITQASQPAQAAAAVLRDIGRG